MFKPGSYEFSAYQMVNSLLALFILLIFIYSALYSPEKGRYPIKSAHTMITGEPSASTGLSRGFSAFVRLNFKAAKSYNPYTLQLAAFFLLQLFLRIIITVFYTSVVTQMGVKRVVIIDAIQASVMFLLFFEPFWWEIVSF